MIIVVVATAPYASGVRRRARIIPAIGEISFDAISVSADHLAAVTTFDSRLFIPQKYSKNVEVHILAEFQTLIFFNIAGPGRLFRTLIFVLNQQRQKSFWGD